MVIRQVASLCVTMAWASFSIKPQSRSPAKSGDDADAGSRNWCCINGAVGVGGSAEVEGILGWRGAWFGRGVPVLLSVS